MLNISDCSPLDNLDSFVTFAYNPLASLVKSWIRIPVVNESYLVFDGNSYLVLSETVRIDEFTIRKGPKKQIYLSNSDKLFFYLIFILNFSFKLEK